MHPLPVGDHLSRTGERVMASIEVSPFGRHSLSCHRERIAACLQWQLKLLGRATLEHMRRFNRLTAVGWIIGTEGGPCYLADLVLQSLPPQVGSGIEVKSLNTDTLPDLRRDNELFWTEKRVFLRGRIEDDVLIVEHPPSPAE